MALIVDYAVYANIKCNINNENYVDWHVTLHTVVPEVVEVDLSRLMGKQTICIGENKDADQLRGNREADQRLCFRYSDSTIPLLL